MLITCLLIFVTAKISDFISKTPSGHAIISTISNYLTLDIFQPGGTHSEGLLIIPGEAGNWQRRWAEPQPRNHREELLGTEQVWKGSWGLITLRKKQGQGEEVWTVDYCSLLTKISVSAFVLLCFSQHSRPILLSQVLTLSMASHLRIKVEFLTAR